MWLNSSPVFHVQGRTGDGGLLAVPEREREFRLRFASCFHVRCIADVIHEGIWPDVHQFIDRYQATLNWERQRDGMRWLIQLHRDLTSVWQRFPAPNGLQATANPQPVVGFLVRERAALFPNFSALRFKALVAPPRSTKPHPLTGEITDADPEEVHRVLRFCNHQRRWLLPVFHDVFVRILFRILPAGARFAFLQQRDPSIILCPREHCSQVETYRHLFLECAYARAVWDLLWTDWAPMLLGDLSIRLLLEQPQVHARYTDEETAAVQTMWHVMRTIVIRTLWLDRNRLIFEHARPRRPTSIAVEALVLFAAHYRGILRHTDPDDHAAYHTIVRQLMTSPTFGSFFASRQELLMIRRRQVRVGRVPPTQQPPN